MNPIFTNLEQTLSYMICLNVSPSLIKTNSTLTVESEGKELNKNHNSLKPKQILYANGDKQFQWFPKQVN